MDDVFEGCTSTIHSFIHSLTQMKISNSCLEAACPVAGTIHPSGPQEMGHIRVFMTESLGMVWTYTEGSQGSTEVRRVSAVDPPLRVNSCFLLRSYWALSADPDLRLGLLEPPGCLCLP